MSKTGKPRRSFTSFVAEGRADPYEIPGDKGEIILTLPRPQFWPNTARELAVKGDNAGCLRVILDDDAAFDAFAAAVGLDAHAAASNLFLYLAEEFGADVGESAASSTS